MTRLIPVWPVIIFFIACFLPVTVTAQHRIKESQATKPSANLHDENPYQSRDKDPRIYYGAELNLGIGLSQVDAPYSKRFISIAALAGYAWNKSLLTGIGAGYNAYNEGSHFPIFMDIRYIIGKTKSKPYLDLQGGLLLKNDSDFDHPRYYINPSAGVIFPGKKKTSFTLAAGLYTQWLMQDGRRDSFADLKLGIMFR